MSTLKRMEKIEDALKYRAIFCKKQSIVYEKMYHRYNVANYVITILQLICTVYITSSYYTTQYIISAANWYNPTTVNAVIVVISMVISVVSLFFDCGRYANENLTASRLYHNIYTDIHGELIKYLPDTSEFDKAQRFASCAMSSGRELEWIGVICPSVIPKSKDKPSDDEIEMENKNYEIVKELGAIRNKSLRRTVTATATPPSETSRPSIFLRTLSGNILIADDESGNVVSGESPEKIVFDRSDPFGGEPQSSQSSPSSSKDIP